MCSRMQLGPSATPPALQIHGLTLVPKGDSAQHRIRGAEAAQNGGTESAEEVTDAVVRSCRCYLVDLCDREAPDLLMPIQKLGATLYFRR